MKDLKYIYEFENLLQEANNDLVKQAKNDGGIALVIHAIIFLRFYLTAVIAFL